MESPNGSQTVIAAIKILKCCDHMVLVLEGKVGNK